MADFLNKEKSGWSEGRSAAKSWYEDKYQSVIIQRNVLLILTVVALAGLGFSIASVATLNASKTFEPFLIQVEENTGIVTTVDKKSMEKYTADEAIIKYFLVKYIQARDGYNADDFQYFVSKVARTLSATDVYRSFRAEIDGANKSSPIHLGRGAVREVEIKSLSKLEPKRWQVRYAVVEYRMPDYSEKNREHFIATINFDFLNVDLSQSERYINPLGFQVLSFRKDKEQVQ